MHHKTKLWNLQVVQNVRRDTALATCLQEQRAQVRRVMYHRANVSEVCEPHQAAIWLQGNNTHWGIAWRGEYWQAQGGAALPPGS